MARHSLNEMAQLLNREAAAKTHLDAFDALIDGTKPHFARRGNRPLLMITLLDPRHVLAFGLNCLFQEVLDSLGIRNATGTVKPASGAVWRLVSTGWRNTKTWMCSVSITVMTGYEQADGDAAVAGDALCARRSFPARSGCLVLWRDSDALYPGAGQCAGR